MFGLDNKVILEIFIALLMWDVVRLAADVVMLIIETLIGLSVRN
jgi:hypothetical protein